MCIRIIMGIAICLAPFFGLAAEPGLAEPHKIAVFSFEPEGDQLPGHIGVIVAEWLTTALVQDKRFEVVERRLVKKLLEEQRLEQSGLVDANHTINTGKLLGVRNIVVGTVIQFLNTVEVNSRVVNVEDGVVLMAEKVTVTQLTNLEAAVVALAHKIAAKLITSH